MEKRKKSRRRRLLIWLGIDVAVAAIVIGLLIYRPAQYHPVVPPPSPDGETVHPYLHRDLGATFYNNAQKQQPFEMVIQDAMLNEAIAGKSWKSEGVALAAPQIFFVPGQIKLMGTAELEGAKFIVTIDVKPQITDGGDLDLPIQRVKVGAMNVTPLARMMGRKMYREQVSNGGIDQEDLGTKIVASLLNNQPFTPLIEVDDKWVQLKSFEITEGTLVAHFIPAKPRK